ncbi:lactation elevated protein 1-like isoform X1 [Leptotrombidium deliense]|uniref:Lactation elevated protein 1-like isoform X1 n=1 Tax=Leptotrombidium deliense TaxID=299467 RepID=A0A443S8W4_9ACAR|nr:lactation elevated protein 1-like isoform X1 [Leptotrombidium deliense]
MNFSHCFRVLKYNLTLVKSVHRCLCVQAPNGGKCVTFVGVIESSLLPYLSASLMSIYEQRVKEGELENDEYQIKVIESFETLNKAINGYTPSKPSYFSKVSNHMFFNVKYKMFFFGKNTTQKAPKGVYLYGSVGCGKTMLMDMFHDHCCVDDNKKRRIHFHAFMLDVHSRIHDKKQSEMFADSSKKALSYNPIPSVAQDLCDEAWLLCLDEFQVTDIGDAMILKLLFTELFNKGVVVIATSNRPPDDLYKHGLQRSNFLPFIPLLKKHCNILPLDSEVDYRQKNLPSKQAIYLIDDQNGNKELDRLFKILASRENDTIRPKTLLIKGRNVTFSKTCGQIADCTFDELCNRPLGAIDYVTMSQLFHTIIIRQIPQLSVEKKSQMRRFITLIDTLYNHKLFKKPQRVNDDENGVDDDKRKLMDDLSISKEEAKAFDGEEEMFAFSRTVSRITEMQTDLYWNSREMNGETND